MEEKEPFYTVDEDVNWYSSYGKQNGGSLKNRVASNLTPEHIPRKDKNSK